MRVLLALVSVLFISLSSTANPPFKIGDTLPEFLGHDLNGKDVYVSDFKGKVLILTFWSASRNQDFQEIAVLHLFQQQLADERFQVVAVNLDKRKEFTNRLVKAIGDTKLSFTYEPMTLSGLGTNPDKRRTKLARSFGFVSTVKTRKKRVDTRLKTFLVHPTGKISAIHIGKNNAEWNLLMSEVKALLKKAYN